MELVTKRVVTGLVLVFLLVATLAMYGAAQSNSSEGSGGNSLRITPLRTNVIIEQGDSKQVEVSLRNISDQQVTLRAITNDFVAGDGESGQAAIMFDENEYAPTHSLKRFMQPIDTVTLGPNEEKTVPVTIVVPASAQPGGYFGAVRFVPADAGSSQVTVATSVASLILLKVPGDYIESLELKEFSVRQDGSAKMFLTTGDNLTAVVRLENKGNVQVAPFGEVFVQKGDEVVYSAKINDVEPQGVILPDSIRKWEVPLENMDDFGKYTVSVTIGYGDTNQTINYERTVWVIPIMYLIAAGALLAVIIGIILAIVFSMRAYKKKILRQSRRR